MHKTYLNGLPASAFTKYVFQKNALDRLIRSGLWGDTVILLSKKKKSFHQRLVRSDDKK